MKIYSEVRKCKNRILHRCNIIFGCIKMLDVFWVKFKYRINILDAEGGV
jgi:hypothetical protein